MNPKELYGTWRLKEAGINDAEGNYLSPIFAPDPQGLLCYNPDGYMFVHIMKSGRHEDDPSEVSDPHQAYYGYCGTFELAGDQVIHNIQVSRDINALGQRFKRRFRLEGNHLHLSWARGDNTGWIIWERILT